jgi:hypothetical protein
MARKPGALCRFVCTVCGAVEMVKGGTTNFRCTECRKDFYGCSPRDTMGKITAGMAVQRAIRRGELPHPSLSECVDCGEPAVFFDHRDYNRPLDVVPVCHSCNLKRGPAIPVHGRLTAVVARGRVPYTLRVRVGQLLDAFNVSRAVLEGMPTKLSVDHWRAILAQLPEGV